jgi:hypothetical protein
MCKNDRNIYLVMGDPIIPGEEGCDLLSRFTPSSCVLVPAQGLEVPVGHKYLQELMVLTSWETRDNRSPIVHV